MGFRSRLSKKFSSKKAGFDSPKSGSTSPPRRTDIEYYKENDIPKSKYRGKVDKAHQERLDSYSLGDAFNTLRRKSSQALSGTFSPGGTKSQSRRGSWIPGAKSGLSSAGLDNGNESDVRSQRRKSVVSAGSPKEDVLDEEDETMVNNSNDASIPQISLQKTITASNPFTMEELEQAMSRAATRPR